MYLIDYFIIIINIIFMADNCGWTTSCGLNPVYHFYYFSTFLIVFIVRFLDICACRYSILVFVFIMVGLL